MNPLRGALAPVIRLLPERLRPYFVPLASGTIALLCLLKGNIQWAVLCGVIAVLTTAGKQMPAINRSVGRAVGILPARARPYAIPGVAFAAALFAVPLLGPFWVNIFTRVAIFVLVAIGANILYGRVGLATLCQIGLMSVGTWVTLRLWFLTGWPVAVVWLIGGIVTMLVGILVGLPALRLGGLQLAMITLMAAGGFAVILNSLSFPNGGPGFKGLVLTVESRRELGRPVFARGNFAWYRFTVVAAVLALCLALWHLRGRPGRAWAAIRQSEPAALAAGIDVTRYKLWAFALASFLTGIAGGVYASSVRSPAQTVFQTPDNVTLFAVVIISAVVIGGSFSLYGAVLAALLKEFLPEFLKTHLPGLIGHLPGFLKSQLAIAQDRPDRIGIILFGVGVLLNLVITTRAAKKKGLSL